MYAIHAKMRKCTPENIFNFNEKLLTLENIYAVYFHL